MRMYQTTLSILLILGAIAFIDHSPTVHAFSIGSNKSLESDPRHSIVIPLIKSHPRLETNLDRAPWNRVALLTGFLVNKGKAMAGEATWVYIFYDRSALWVAIRCEGRGSADLKTDITERDGKVWKDDSIAIVIDPVHEHKEYYHFIVNSTGVIYDAHGKNKDWNAPILVKTITDDRGWTAILRIGFSRLQTRRPNPGTVWGINFYRNSSMSERSCWAPAPRSFIVSEDFGHIVFGSEDTKSIRFHRITPINIGANRMVFDHIPGISYRIEGKDSGKSSVFKKEGKIPTDGKLSWFVSNDSTRRIEVILFDRSGTRLAWCWFPMRSPAVSASVVLLKDKFKQIEKNLSRFPRDARKKVDVVLADSRPFLDEAIRTLDDQKLYTPANWERLREVATNLERELDDTWSYSQTLVNFPHAGFAVGLETPMQKVMIRDFPFKGRIDNSYNLSLAKNEHEGLQVVVIPFHRELSEVGVSVSPFRDEKNNIREDIIAEVSLVGHVDVADNPPYEAEYKDWWPDPLLYFQNKCDVRVGEHVAYWINISTQPDTLTGIYKGTITVTAADCRPLSIRLNVNVWDFALPEGTHLRNAFTYNEPQVELFYGNRWDRKLAYRYYDFILDHLLNIDHLYRKDPPDIEVVKYGISCGMNAFNVGGVFRYISNNRTVTDLDQYVSKLKQEGLFDSAYVYGFDEVKEDKFTEIREVFGTIHKSFPGLETMTTAVDHSFGKDTGLREVVDIWVPLTDWYDLDEARKLRAEDKEMWWYICVVPVHPYANWFIEYPAIESRLLTGAMSHKYKTGGFLYYMINLWTGNQKLITSGPYTDWDPGSFVNEKKGYTANGDGSLLCPGPDGPLSTIRLENIRDGLEDYEYLYLLAELVRKIRDLPETARNLAYLDRANRLLAVPNSLVRSLTEYTRDPNVIYEYRALLAKHIIEGKQILDGHSSRSMRH